MPYNLDQEETEEDICATCHKREQDLHIPAKRELANDEQDSLDMQVDAAQQDIRFGTVDVAQGESQALSGDDTNAEIDASSSSAVGTQSTLNPGEVSKADSSKTSGTAQNAETTASSGQSEARADDRSRSPKPPVTPVKRKPRKPTPTPPAQAPGGIAHAVDLDVDAEPEAVEDDLRSDTSLEADAEGGDTDLDSVGTPS